MKSVLFSAILALTFTQASAASFDCAKANSPSSKQICSEPELSKLDDELAVVFSEARSKLSVESQKLLIEGQRSWLRFHSRLCFFDDEAKPKDKKASVECQINEYRSRIEALKSAGSLMLGVKIIPYFQGWVDINTRKKMVKHEKGIFPLFEGMSTTARALNAIIHPIVEPALFDSSGKLKDTDDHDFTRFSSAVKVTDVGSDLAVIEHSTEGVFSENYSNSVLYFSKTLNRPIKISDVFKSQEWTSKAKNIAIKRLKSSGDEDQVEEFKELFDPRPEHNFTYTINADGFTIDLPSRLIRYPEMIWRDFSEFLTPLGQRLSRISRK
jgi:uncharacterized protein